MLPSLIGATRRRPVYSSSGWRASSSGPFSTMGLTNTSVCSPDGSKARTCRRRQRLGALLLTPHANTGTLKAYARYLWDVGDIACDLLGKADCARRIRQLAKLGDPLLRKSACGFLKGQLHEGCQ